MSNPGLFLPFPCIAECRSNQSPDRCSENSGAVSTGGGNRSPGKQNTDPFNVDAVLETPVRKEAAGGVLC